MRDRTKNKEYKNENGEFNLEFTMLAPSKSLSFLMYAGKIIGGSAGKIIGSLGSSKDLEKLADKDMNLEKIGDALFGSFDRIEDKEFQEKLNILLSSVSVNGKVLDIDHTMFYGETLLIFQIAKEAMGVNYSSFLGASSGVIGKLTKSVKVILNSKKSPKGQASTGSSGDQ